MSSPTHTSDQQHWDSVAEAAELLHDERFQDALYALRDVAKENPKNPYAFYFMGTALFELGQIELARDAYRAAVRLAPSYLGARVALAHVLRILHDLTGAIREGEAALEVSPDDGDSMHALGLAHAAQGNRDEAKRWLDAFLKTDPEVEVALETRQLLETLADGSGPVELSLRLVRSVALTPGPSPPWGEGSMEG